jgi:uncharacterized lipoprotein YbaY
MRTYWLAAIAALSLLGGCNTSTDTATPDKSAAPAIAPGTAITGSVTLHDPMTIGAGKLEVHLVDVAQPQPAIAEKTLDVSGAAPFNFSLDFDRSKIVAGRTYVLNTTLVDGDRRFQAGLAAPVLTHGAGTNVQIMLTAEATPAENLKAEFAKLQGRIGGMKTVNGTYTTDTTSVAWDAFGEGGVVRYVRVNTELDAGGRSAVYYGFKDGKVMAVQQKGGALVGWGDDGSVLVNEKHGGGQVAPAEITAMHDAAMKALQMAQEKLDAARKK